MLRKGIRIVGFTALGLVGLAVAHEASVIGRALWGNHKRRKVQ